MSPIIQDPLLTDAEAAAYLTIKPHTLAVWRTSGRYRLVYVKCGRLVRYRKSDLDAFLARRTMGASDDAA